MTALLFSHCTIMHDALMLYYLAAGVAVGVIAIAYNLLRNIVGEAFKNCLAIAAMLTVFLLIYCIL